MQVGGDIDQYTRLDQYISLHLRIHLLDPSATDTYFSSINMKFIYIALLATGYAHLPLHSFIPYIALTHPSALAAPIVERQLPSGGPRPPFSISLPSGGPAFRTSNGPFSTPPYPLHSSINH
jgi:hypothetical protein